MSDDTPADDIGQAMEPTSKVFDTIILGEATHQALTVGDFYQRLLLGLTRGIALADHIGDACEELILAWRIAGLGDIPLDDHGNWNLDELEAMGAVSLWDDSWKDEEE